MLSQHSLSFCYGNHKHHRPRFLAVLLGKGLEYLRFFPERFLDQLSVLSLPASSALLVSRISKAQFEFGTTIRMNQPLFYCHPPYSHHRLATRPCPTPHTRQSRCLHAR